MPENQKAIVDTTEFIQRLHWRYAVKKFDAQKKVSAQDWQVLAESLRLSPSSYGLQPWKFLVVQTPELRKQLTPLSWKQTQVEDCSHYVVFTTLKKVTTEYIQHFIDVTAKTREIPSESLNGYRDMMIGDLVKGPRAAVIQNWSQKQSYIAMGNLMNAAALMGVDTCPMEGLDPAAYDKVLGLDNTPYATVAAVAVGYRSAEDKYSQAKKIRFSSEEIFETR